MSAPLSPMNFSEIEYKRKDKLKTKKERFQYLHAVHLAMADKLFDQHVLSIAFPHTMSSGGYIEDNDSYWSFETYFAADGNTAHTLFQVPEAKDWYDAIKEKGCVEITDIQVTCHIVH